MVEPKNPPNVPTRNIINSNPPENEWQYPGGNPSNRGSGLRPVPPQPKWALALDRATWATWGFQPALYTLITLLRKSLKSSQTQGEPNITMRSQISAFF